MYAVTVRTSAMIAHSLPGEVFGPAQGLHGATYVVEAMFRRRELDQHQIVVDIGAATETLGAIISEIRYRNLDDHPEFAGVLTTTEVLAKWVADRLLATPVGQAVDALTVTLRESPDAWASYSSG